MLTQQCQSLQSTTWLLKKKRFRNFFSKKKCINTAERKKQYHSNVRRVSTATIKWILNLKIFISSSKTLEPLKKSHKTGHQQEKIKSKNDRIIAPHFSHL